MSTTTTTERVQLATTFKPDEVRVLCVILAKLQTGGDVATLLRSDAVRRVHAKFLRMRDKADECDL